ncbi:DNA lyase Apn2 [Trichophyton verrucosum HKI 0517]|uniref:DNA-(apurinic or apyrimidinic site) endonuclease 2 n=1 Tax=Trichophyton verrucosum (strain HKI 0517) TaxID=663202 RepID=D4D4N3_TRIVH|nr:DNA lyase Apn2 [Trichophyton verrucosum HKI 0517]EFE43235.1 DNA lyase Apn2 [Trichophyton verrucosum HKI 0517]
MFDILEADIVVFQEAKIQRKDLQDDMVLVSGWDCYFSLPRQKKGIYVFSKCAAIRAEEGVTGALCPPSSRTPFRQLSASEQIGGYPSIEQMEELSEVDPITVDSEGRCLILEFPAFVLIGVYCPADRDETRDDFRLGFFNLLEVRVRNLVKMGKRVILAGDLNTCAGPIDSAPALERIRKGTETEEEYLSYPARRIFNRLVRPVGSTGDTHDTESPPVLRDLCREFHPSRTGMYTCWNQKVNARPGNYGSRIDYILCSDNIRSWFVESNIQEGLIVCVKFGLISPSFNNLLIPNEQGSDHCPVYASIGDRVPFDGKDVHILDIMNPKGTFDDGVEQPRSNKITPLALSGRLIPEFDRRRNIKDMFRNHSLSRNNSEVKMSTTTDTLAGSEIPGPASQTKSAQENKTARVTMNHAPKRSHSTGVQAPPSKRLKPKGRPSGARSNGQQTLVGFFKSERTSRAVSEENATASSDSPQEAPAEVKITPASELASTAQNNDSVPTAVTTSPDNSVVPSCSPTESWSKVFTRKPVPKCEGHHEDCISLVTKKPGINCGRSFWICPRPLGPSGDKESGTPWRCPTFIWSSDWRSS